MENSEIDDNAKLLESTELKEIYENDFILETKISDLSSRFDNLIDSLHKTNNRLINPKFLKVFRGKIEQLEDTMLNESREMQTALNIMAFTSKYLLLFILILQLGDVSVLTAFDLYLKTKNEVSEKVFNTVELMITIITQGLSICMVCSSTVYLTKLMKQPKISSNQLAQSYISTILVFAGLYFILFRNQTSCIEIQGKEDGYDNTIAIFQYIKLLYLSVSSATLCGAANVQPVGWYVTLIVCIQNIINFVYFASILAQTIGSHNNNPEENKKMKRTIIVK